MLTTQKLNGGSSLKKGKITVTKEQARGMGCGRSRDYLVRMLSLSASLHIIVWAPPLSSDIHMHESMKLYNVSAVLSWLSPFILNAYVGMFTGPWVHMCACVQKTWDSFFITLPPYRVKFSQSDPELANMASLPRHSVPGFGLHFLKLELQLGHHAHLAWCGLWRSNLWSYCLHDKCFTHWANTPPSSPGH